MNGGGAAAVLEGVGVSSGAGGSATAPGEGRGGAASGWLTVLSDRNDVASRGGPGAREAEAPLEGGEERR